MYSVEFFDVEMEVLFSVGSHAWIIKIIVIKRKSFNWDRYSWYQSQGFISRRSKRWWSDRLHMWSSLGSEFMW